jgi:hypothetical protein
VADGLDSRFELLAYEEVCAREAVVAVFRTMSARIASKAYARLLYLEAQRFAGGLCRKQVEDHAVDREAHDGKEPEGRPAPARPFIEKFMDRDGESTRKIATLRLSTSDVQRVPPETFQLR